MLGSGNDSSMTFEVFLVPLLLLLLLSLSLALWPRSHFDDDVALGSAAGEPEFAPLLDSGDDSVIDSTKVRSEGSVGVSRRFSSLVL